MRNLLLALLASMVIVLVAMPAPAEAASASSTDIRIYMQLDGIEGESRDKGYEKWIALQAVDFELTGPSAWASPAGGAGKANFERFEIAKQVDSATIPLLLKEAKGSSIAAGTIVYTRAGARGPTPYLTFDLQHITISSYTYDADTGSESISLGFGGIRWSYWPLDSKGTPSGKPIQGEWNFSPTDTIAPTTTITYAPVLSAGNRITALSVTLATADLGGSGVARTEYRINGGTWTSYTGAFTIEAASTHTLEWRSIDAAGNSEKTWSADFDEGTPPRQAA
ncbi:type VI protein secretion system component Hcp [Paenibacillus phyllosphaerae]|uniref:Type VI protein secretion system component Hcp n=1 Tax=Paenibacillus phyllosphaerae TaxID=274593 RepID=A0A7W5AY17_9BACL|nr:type VI secretion system tube protein Hcp [Paenibacillus phyllosphaerae]MBB3110843.1 type VI protein secretion system component Hcp [Paenibacillus phyllosphaerae]